MSSGSDRKHLLVGLLGSFKSESSSIKIEFNNLSKEVMSLILCNFHGRQHPRSFKRSGTLFKSLLFWLAGEVSWLALEVLSPCRK